MELGFFLKKFISFFIHPSGMVFTLFALGLIFLYIKKEKSSKVFLSLSFFFLFLFSYPPFVNYLVENLENQYPKYDYKEDIQYIHVLGSGHNTDTMQPISSHIGSSGTKRVLEGVIIHKRTENSKIIFTGFKGKTDISNAVMASQLALALGVKKEDMIINKYPKDTKEEALFAKTLIGNEPFVLVTSATHMPRAMMLFKSLGLNPIAAPTDFHKQNFRGYLRPPSSRDFYISTVAIHEYIGILWTRISE